MLSEALLSSIACPACKQPSLVQEGGSALRCSCGASYAIREGIPVLVGASSPLLPSDAVQREYWESDLGHREAQHPIVAGFSRQRWQYLERLVPLRELRTALDVGAGNGFSTAHAPSGLHCTAVDGAWHMLRRHPGQDRVLADAQALPFRDRAFDVAFCWELLHHVAEPWRVLKEMARVSRGWVFCLEPNPFNLAQAGFAALDPEHRWVFRFTRRYLFEQFRSAGLEPLAFQRVGLIFPNKTPSWLYPALAALPFRIPLIGISQLVVARVR